MNSRVQKLFVDVIIFLVLKAQNLPLFDHAAKPDPFVTVKLCDQVLKTKAKRKTNTPEWNEEFVLYSMHLNVLMM